MLISFCKSVLTCTEFSSPVYCPEFGVLLLDLGIVFEGTAG